jgi:hypothetical protein
MAEPVCCFHVTLGYKIDFCTRGSNYNIFAIKTLKSAIHAAIIKPRYRIMIGSSFIAALYVMPSLVY